MRLVGALALFLLASASAQAAVYPLPVPDWVLPALEQAPAHSPEKVLLALWILGFPCPELDDQFEPVSVPSPEPPPAYVPPFTPPLIYVPPGPPPTSVPEPGTWLLMLIGFASIVVAGLRQRASTENKP